MCVDDLISSCPRVVCVYKLWVSFFSPQHTTKPLCMDRVRLSTHTCVCAVLLSLSFFLCSILPKTLHKRSARAHKAKPLRGWDLRDIIRGDYREGGHRSVIVDEIILLTKRMRES